MKPHVHMQRFLLLFVGALLLLPGCEQKKITTYLIKSEAPSTGDDTYIPDVAVGEMLFSNTWVPDQIQQGNEANYEFTVKNQGTESFREINLVIQGVPLKGREPEELNPDNLTKEMKTLAVIPIADLEPEQVRDLAYTLPVPVNLEPDLYQVYFQVSYSQNALSNPGMFAVPVTNVIVGEATEPNLRILSYSMTQGYSFEKTPYPSDVVAGDPVPDEPSFLGINLEIEAMGTHVQDPVSLEFKLMIEDVGTFPLSFAKDFIDSAEEQVLAADNASAVIRLQNRHTLGQTCEFYDESTGNFVISLEEEPLAGEPGVLCASMFRQAQTTYTYQFYLTRELLTALNRVQAETSRATLIATLDPDDEILEYQNYKEDNELRVPLVFLNSTQGSATAGARTTGRARGPYDRLFCFNDFCIDTIEFAPDFGSPGWGSGLKLYNDLNYQWHDDALIPGAFYHRFIGQAYDKTSRGKQYSVDTEVELDFNIDNLLQSYFYFRNLKKNKYGQMVYQEILIDMPTEDELWLTADEDQLGQEMLEAFQGGYCDVIALGTSYPEYCWSDALVDDLLSGGRTANATIGIGDSDKIRLFTTQDRETKEERFLVYKETGVTGIWIIGPVPVDYSLDIRAFAGFKGDLSLEPENKLTLTPAILARVEASVSGGVGADVDFVRAKLGLGGTVKLIDFEGRMDTTLQVLPSYPKFALDVGFPTVLKGPSGDFKVVADVCAKLGIEICLLNLSDMPVRFPSVFQMEVEAFSAGATCAIKDEFQTPAGGLQLHYTFNGNAFNTAQNAYHGEVPFGTYVVRGYKEDAYQFDGYTETFQVRYDNSSAPEAQAFADLLNSEQSTLSLWLKPIRFVAGNTIASNQQSPGNQGFVVSMSNDNGSVSLDVGGTQLELSNALVLGQWNHLGVLRDGDAFRLTVNGQEVSQSMTYTNSSDFFSLACTRCDEKNAATYFQGVIDDVLFYNRVISGDELAVIASSTINLEDRVEDLLSKIQEERLVPVCTLAWKGASLGVMRTPNVIE